MKNILYGLGVVGISRFGRKRELNKRYTYVINQLNTKRCVEIFGLEKTSNAINSELSQIESKNVWMYLIKEEAEALLASGNHNVLPSSLLLKDKYDAAGEVICPYCKSYNTNQSRIQKIYNIFWSNGCKTIKGTAWIKTSCQEVV